MTSSIVNNISALSPLFRMQRHGFSVLGSDATNRRAMSSITELGISGSSANREVWTEFQIAPNGDNGKPPSLLPETCRARQINKANGDSRWRMVCSTPPRR
jgi:hypothetical protein